MALEQGVLVIGETTNEHLSTITAELLTVAQALAKPSESPIAATFLGDDLSQPAQEAIQAGADKVYTVEHPLLSRVQIDLYLAALQAVCTSINPDTILIGRSALGRQLAPRLACRLGVSLLQDCLEVY